MDRPPPQGPPPSYAFVTRVYNRNLRPVVLAVAFLAGFWSLFSGIGFFRNVPFYNNQGASALATISIVLGALYMFVCVVEAIGIFAGVTQRLVPARIFAWLSGVVIIVIAGIGLTRTVIHFTMKSTIINTCINANEGATFVYTGFWGPVSSGTVDAATAKSWCSRSWDRGSWSEILAFLATSFLAGLFASVAFGFYRQLLDPTSVANAWRAPSNQIRMDGYPTHYAPPYNAAGPAPYPTYVPYSGSNTAYGGNPAYPAFQPPQGPPPLHQEGYETKPPGYDGGGWNYGANRENKDPFGEDGPSLERDVTSRPAPGGHETFR